MIPKIKVYKNSYGNPKFSYVCIIVLTGSIFENKNEKGISHFIEHLIFKGSEYNQNLKDLNDKLNSKGMNVNAYTTPFITAFHIDTPTKYLDYAIEILVKIVFNPLFREEDINLERKVVINELVEKTRSPENLAYMKAHKIIYPKENPLHNPTIGSKKVLRDLTRSDVIKYYEKFYQPQNIIFFTSTQKNSVIVKNDWIRAYEKYGNPGRKYPDYPSTLEMFKKLKPKLGKIGKPGLFRLTKYFPRNDSYYVMANFVLPNLNNDEIFGLDIYANYLAGSLSSKLFIELREKKQLIYSINTDVLPRIDMTTFIIEFNCEKNEEILYECIKTIDHVLRDYYKNGMPQNEFIKFKNKTLINYEKVKSKGIYKINRFIHKYYYGISEYDYESVLRKMTNKRLWKMVKKIFKKKKEFVFIV